MNFFEFYGISEAFNVDNAAIKRKFYELSKEFHPDFFVNDSPEKQEEILHLSTQNNKAYQVLSNPQKIVEYILQLHNQITEGEKYQLPQDFLLEMMEINETLMELEFNADQDVLANTLKQIDSIEYDILNELKSYKDHYDNEQNKHERELLLLKIKDLYFRQKYLLRIRGSLNKFASR